MPQPAPRQILETLLPVLKTAGAYARQVQTRVAAHPDKYDSENFFANALTDADLSVQTFVEVALLAHFPDLCFHGEEYEKSHNTKYFRSTTLGPASDLLVTLDPIDGTRFYLDGHPNYQVILSVIEADGYRAVLAISPSQGRFYYALRGEGTFVGTLNDTLETCQPLQVGHLAPAVMLGWRMGYLAEALRPRYTVYDVRCDYSSETPIPNVNGLLTGDLAGVVLAQGKFIDGAALAFMAQEMGYILTDHRGQPLPAPSEVSDLTWPGIVIAADAAVHADLLAAIAGQAIAG